MTAAFSTSEDDIVNITASFTLSADLSNIFSSMTINGSDGSGGNYTINGAGSHRAISLAISGANVTINNLTITDSQAPTNVAGGAILYENGSSLTLNNVTIRDSESSYSGSNTNGGAIHCTAPNLTIRNSRIHGNTGVDGGGIYISSNCANAKIINSSIYDNDSTGNGGGIHIWGGTIVNANAPSVTITNSLIYGNTAGTSATVKDGGGIYVRGTTTKSATLTVSNSSIYNNLAYSDGGGVYANGQTTFTMNNSAVYSNESKSNAGGGGLALRNAANTPATYTIVNSSIFSNTTAGRGAGIQASMNYQSTTSVLNLRHVTITRNTSNLAETQRGDGLYVVATKVTIQNSIISGNFQTGTAASNCLFDGLPTASQSAALAPVTANNIVGPGSTGNAAPHCTANADPADPLLVAPSVHRQGNFFIPRAGSPAIDSIGNADCLSGVTTDQRGRTRPNPPGGNCDKGAIEDPGWSPPPPQVTTTRTDFSPPPPGDDVGGGGGGGGDSIEEDDEYSAPPVSTCLTLDGIAAYNLSESTQCQRVNAMQIANPNIKEGDFVDAVDVWSWVMPNTQICFEAAGGSFTFIDTAAMPRTVQDWAACSLNGMTCGTINGPGMLVLLPGDPPSDCASPAAQAAQISAQGLSNCMVRTQFNLNFRAAPDGEITGGVPHNATLTALERTSGWFKVDYHGERGWISAEYVDKKGTCG